MYRDVLIPTDGSDGTKRAIRHGLVVANRFDAAVHALTVRGEGPYGSLESDQSDGDGDAELERALELVEREANRQGVDVVRAIRRGAPHEEILEYADERGIDLIVMGTHGRTGVDRVLVGSVTERVVREASVPVLTVRVTEAHSVGDAEEAESLARTALEEQGHSGGRVTDEPHRTSGSWIVPVEIDGESAHVHVDASTGDARIAGPNRD